MDFEIIDFNSLPQRKRRAILSESVKDMDRIAIARKMEGINPRGFFMQRNNIIQIGRLHYESDRHH